jgi:phenylpyruvate tautomerase PptA (4-oxalocrotonate tautomerase family)
MAKPGVKPIYDVQMTERLFMRLTAEQKTRLQLAVRDTAGTSDFWREFMLLSADVILTAEDYDELKEQLAERLSSFLVEFGVVEPMNMKPKE